MSCRRRCDVGVGLWVDGRLKKEEEEEEEKKKKKKKTMTTTKKRTVYNV
jgi:hypothetical protein